MVRGDLGTFESVERDTLAGRALLWLVWREPDTIEAICITQIAHTEKSKVCTVIACSGTKPRRWLHLLERIEMYARGTDCDCVRIFGRKGWLRLLKDYSAPKVILEKRL